MADNRDHQIILKTRREDGDILPDKPKEDRNMAELNVGGVIKAALSLNCNERYADGIEKHEMAGKILFYFDKEEAAESIVVPIIYETGAYVRNGNITIHRDGRCSYEYEA